MTRTAPSKILSSLWSYPPCDFLWKQLCWADVERMGQLTTGHAARRSKRLQHPMCACSLMPEIIAICTRQSVSGIGSAAWMRNHGSFESFTLQINLWIPIGEATESVITLRPKIWGHGTCRRSLSSSFRGRHASTFN